MGRKIVRNKSRERKPHTILFAQRIVGAVREPPLQFLFVYVFISANHLPKLRAMMRRITSEVPAKMVCMRPSTQNLEIGYSSQ